MVRTFKEVIRHALMGAIGSGLPLFICTLLGISSPYVMCLLSSLGLTFALNGIKRCVEEGAYFVWLVCTTGFCTVIVQMCARELQYALDPRWIMVLGLILALAVSLVCDEKLVYTFCIANFSLLMVRPLPNTGFDSSDHLSKSILVSILIGAFYFMYERIPLSLRRLVMGSALGEFIMEALQYNSGFDLACGAVAGLTFGLAYHIHKRKFADTCGSPQKRCTLKDSKTE